MATLLFVSVITINIMFSSSDSVSDFDWTDILEQLQDAYTLWQENEINSYIFRVTTTGFIPVCAQVPKYVTVENGIITDVQYDEDYITSNDLNECPSSFPINNNHYSTIDQYYDQHIQDAETAIETCNNSTSAQYNLDGICSDSILFEYNDILHYPTTLKSYGERPLYTTSCLTAIDSDTDIDLSQYNNECALCSNIQEECESNDECCDGICAEPKWNYPWNPSLKACCYDLYTETQSTYECKDDNDCCEDYICDSQRCVEALRTTEIDIIDIIDSIDSIDTTEAVMIVCGDNKNSGRYGLIECISDADCCVGFQCKVDKGKCKINHASSSLHMLLGDYASIIVAITFTMNICVVFVCCCRNRDKVYKRVLFDLHAHAWSSDDTSTDDERIIIE